MAFDPFAGPGRDFFGQSRFSDSANQEASIMAGLAGDAVANKNYVEAAKRASEYQKQMIDYQNKAARDQARSSTRSSIFGTIGTIGSTALILF